VKSASLQGCRRPSTSFLQGATPLTTLRKTQMMKKILFVLSIFGLFGCYSYNVVTENAHDIEKLPAYCENAVFVASDFIDVSTAPSRTNNVDPQSLMTIARVLKFAKAKYGEDVTVVNFRYDVISWKRKRNISVTFDVVRCP